MGSVVLLIALHVALTLDERELQELGFFRQALAICLGLSPATSFVFKARSHVACIHLLSLGIT